MVFDILGIVALMCCSAATGAAIAYDLGEARASRIWDARVRELRERVSEISQKAMLFAAVDLPAERSIALAFGPAERHSVEDDQYGYFDMCMHAQSQHKGTDR